MDSTRKTAIVAGVVLIIATVASIVGSKFVPLLTGTDYLTRVSENANQVATEAMLSLIASLASAGVAIALYPVLRKTKEGLALGSVVFRALEAVMYMVGPVCLLTLRTLGQQFAAAGAADRASLQAIGDSLVSVRDHAGLLGVFAFCLGGFIYYYLFYRARLIPRWLSGFGIAAIILMGAACVLSLFSDSPITGYVALAAPIGVQEMLLAIWLIVKGFNSSAMAAESAEPATQDALRTA